VPQTRRESRDAALVELQRLHAAILASRARRGVGPDGRPATQTASPEAVATRELTRRLQEDAPADDALEPVSRSRRGWWLAVAAAVIAAGTWAALTVAQRREVTTEASRSSPGVAPSAVPPRESASSAAAPGAAPSPAPAPSAAIPAKPIRVALVTIRPVWLRVTADGIRAVEREVPAGETLSFEGDRAIVVRSGDAGGVQATLNGVERGPLGRNGWPLTVSITPEGIKALTPTRPEF
jgi:cytoskeleton protein RodZ